MVPRTFTSPITCAGAPGRRVAAPRGNTSRTASAAQTYTRPPARKISERSGAESSDGEIVEAKRFERIGVFGELRLLAKGGERPLEIIGKRRAKIQLRAGDWVL